MQQRSERLFQYLAYFDWTNPGMVLYRGGWALQRIISYLTTHDCDTTKVHLCTVHLCTRMQAGFKALSSAELECCDDNYTVRGMPTWHMNKHDIQILLQSWYKILWKLFGWLRDQTTSIKFRPEVQSNLSLTTEVIYHSTCCTQAFNR